MAVPETLELARTGDPEAIATILHEALVNHQIRVHLDCPSAHLDVYLRSEVSPDYAQTFPVVQQTLRHLNCDLIRTVTVSGGIRGEVEPQWHDTFTVQTVIFLKPIRPPHDAITTTETIVSSLLDAFPDRAEAMATASGGAAESPSAIGELAAPRAGQADSEVDLEPGVIYHPVLDDWQQDWGRIFRRPETVALVAFAIALLLWDSYVGLMQGTKQRPITASRLARRLGVEPSRLVKQKHQPDFSAWTQDLDPEGVAWVYRYGLYIPLESELARS